MPVPRACVAFTHAPRSYPRERSPPLCDFRARPNNSVRKREKLSPVLVAQTATERPAILENPNTPGPWRQITRPAKHFKRKDLLSSERGVSGPR